MKRVAITIVNWVVLLTIPIWGGTVLLGHFIIEGFRGDEDVMDIIKGLKFVGRDL